MQFRDLLDLFHRIAGVAIQSDLSDNGTRPGRDMEGHVDLVLLLVALFGDAHSRLVESIVFHHSLYACQSTVTILPSVEFAELQQGLSSQLITGRVTAHTS